MPSRNASEKFPRVGVSVFLAFVSWIAGLNGAVFAAVPMQQSTPPALSVGIGRTAPRTITVGKSGAYDYSTIQAAIDAATTGDTVVVYPATYGENINFKGKNIILRSTNPTDSATVAATIIDGNSSGSVVTFAGSETATCGLFGFTIRNGYANYGAGIWGREIHIPTQTHARIQYNVITSNTAIQDGGGLADCGGVIANNVIRRNRAHQGGGFFNCGGTIEGNIVSDNMATYGGGLDSCDGVIVDNTIGANSAVYGGGLVRCDGLIRDNVISNNMADYGGGGLDYCLATILNNVISGNSAAYGGGLYQCERGMIANCTIVGNSASSSYFGGGGLSGCYATIRNCIIWANNAATGPQLKESSVPSYSCVQGSTGGGVGNISAAPLLTTGPLGPYYLSQTAAGQSAQSPCVDAGSGTAIEAGLGERTTRTDGVPDTGTVDMGYHYGSAVSVPVTIAALPTAFNLSILQGSQCPPQTLVIWNRGSGTLSYSLATSPTWLISVHPSSGTSPGEYRSHTVFFDTGALSSGTYTGQIRISGNATNSPYTIPVSIRVAPPTIATSPTSFSITVYQASQANDQSLVIGNGGLGILDYSIATSPAGMVAVLPASGRSARSANVHTATFATSILEPGAYSGQIVITGNAPNSPFVIPVRISVLAIVATIDALPTSATVGVHEGLQASQTLRIRNSGRDTLSYSMTASPSWLMVWPASGASTTETRLHTLYVNASGLPPGKYEGEIRICGYATNSPVVIPVTAVSLARMAISPTSFAITTVEGAPPTTRTLRIRNNGPGTLSYSLQSFPGSLMTIQPPWGRSTNEATTHIVSFNTNLLSRGTYEGAIGVNSNVNRLLYVPVTFQVMPPPAIGISTQRFDITISAGTQSTTRTLLVANYGGGLLSYALATSPTWLIDVQPSSGTSLGERKTHTVTLNTATLSAGTHRGYIRITANATNSPTTVIPVTLTVVPAPPPPEPFHTAWSTYLGGSGMDGAGTVVTDRDGNIFVAANTESADFPTSAVGNTTRHATDIAVSKLNGDGTLLWTKFLAGNEPDFDLEIAADSHGNLFLTGFTWSTDFATPGAYDTTYNGGGSSWGDGFVAKISPTGDKIWATYLGGSGQDYGWGIAVDSAGNVYVTGMTDSRDFPVVGSQSRGPNGDRDSFVAKLSADGRRLLWSTYLGGHGEDLGYRVALDNGGGVYVGGRTMSRDFPTTGIHSASFRGGSFDGYVAKLSTDGRLLWSTCLGGSGDEGVADVLWDRHGHVYATGGTTSANFPGLGSSDSTLHGNSDAFVTKFSADGFLLRSALFGGSGMDAGGELALDAAGNLCLAGVAGSPDFPVEGGVGFAGGSSDVFVMGFDGSDTLVRSTCLGGHGSDLPRGIATDTAGGVIVVGQTSSTDFPTTRAWQPTYGGGAWDGFITKFGGVPATTQPLIAVIPVRFDLSVTEGIRPATATLWVWNRGVGTLRYQIRAPNVMPAIFPPLNFGMQVTPSTGQSSGQRNSHHVSFFEVEHLLPGVYNQNIVISGNATNSPTTVPVRITISPRPPSLVVSPTRFDVAVTAGQQSTTRTLQVRNGGGGTLAYTVATSPSWLISVQPPSGTATGTGNHHVVTFATRGLAPGTYSGRLTVAATMPPLTVFVPAVVTVNAPLLPNLTVSHVDVAPKTPVQVHPGDRIALSAFLENAGEANAGPFWTEVWGSKTGGLTLDRLLVPSLRLTGGLRVGGSYSWVANAPLASIPDGRYTVVYAADRLGQVAESSERDNRAVVRAKSILVVRPQTQIDLAVEGFGMSPNPAQSGGLVRFAGQVINRGTQASGAFWIEFWGSRDWPYPSLSFPLCASMLVQNLAPGARVDLSTLSRRLYNVPTGVFMAGCVADRQDSVNETNKTNNYQFVDGQVFNHSTLITRPPDERGAAGRDIVVRSTDFSPAAPTQLASGSTLTLTVELANPGTMNTGPFWLEYWGSLDGGLTLKNLLVDSARITNIAPGQTVRLSGRKRLGRMADGLYTIVVVADRLKQVSETNEGNNRRAIAGKRLLVVRPQTGANLVVEQFRFYLPFWPRVEPYGVVRNTGTANSGSFWVEFWACPGDADYPTPVWMVCPAMRVENLPPGGSLNLLTYRPNAYNSLPAGLSTILCIVDRTDQAVETDETDNYQMTRRVLIPPH